MTTLSPEQLQQRALEYVKQGQQSVAQVIGTLSENYASALRTAVGVGGTWPGVSEGAPKPAEAIDRAVDFGIQLLESHRGFAHQLLDATAPVVKATEAAVDSAAERVRNH